MKRETIEDLQDNSFYEELTGTTDRHAAIIAAIWLENILGQLISTRLINGDEILASTARNFDDKIKLAYGMKLINHNERRTLDAIRNIRNSFAHGWFGGLSYRSPELDNYFNEIKVPTDIFSNKTRDLEPRRSKFLAAVLFLELRMKAIKVKQNRN